MRQSRTPVFLSERRLPIGILLGVLLAGAATSAAAQHGIMAGDIDRDANACTDFFQYANGSWRKDHPIPDYMDRWSRRWESGEINKEHVRDILTEVSAKSDWPAGSADQLSGDFYAACMNEPAVDALGMKPVEPMLAAVRAIKTRADVEKQIGAFHDVGINVPFGIAGFEDLHDPTQTIAHVFAGGLGMPDRDYYLKPEKRFVEAREKYLAHVARMFELAGADADSAKKSADTVFAFEKRLAEASLDNVALRDPSQQDHRTSFADLGKMTPSFDWGTYADAAKIPRADLNVTEPAFLAQFERELAKTPVSDWKTYLEWHLLNAAADTLSKPFVEENFAFNGRYLTGATEMKPRWKRCAEATDNQLGEALGKKYVEKYFPPAAKARMQDMVHNILLAMKDTIVGLDWMSAETKAKAQEKLATFNPKIGYPDKWKTYAGVKVGRDSYWDNFVAASRWNVADNRSQIGKPVDRSRWGMTPPTSNAYYNPLQNEIVFPAGILQPPAFDMSATDAINYGAIGVVIGHEVSHGFDDQGAQFDAKGRLSNWWTPADLKQFGDRGQCVVDQFESYFIEPGIHHNGKLVLGESIGDLAGAKLAWLAYQKSREGKKPEPTIDGFTPAQQFFIAWGQWRGDEIRPATQRTMIQGDPHPIAKYRVNGPLSNLPAFQQAFECKPDAPMVRTGKERCEVW
ncbi:M13 family metallopeptidase [Dokdonella immobilis]|uniref:Endothelin-converting enzyme/putative endopeptidase n=1 Tax=Dokdonella immobilis TaxID=578942 RepID=A0A1I5B3H7_9GAMM|nr:M13 family metallopeptidase [Dokdonella immobilis]SFN69254.1 endothelin-converting enzyme/putative endopeptidase [Dokdonella immobilis]